MANPNRNRSFGAQNTQYAGWGTTDPLSWAQQNIKGSANFLGWMDSEYEKPMQHVRRAQRAAEEEVRAAKAGKWKNTSKTSVKDQTFAERAAIRQLTELNEKAKRSEKEKLIADKKAQRAELERDQKENRKQYQKELYDWIDREAEEAQEKLNRYTESTGESEDSYKKAGNSAEIWNKAGLNRNEQYALRYKRDSRDNIALQALGHEYNLNNTVGSAMNNVYEMRLATLSGKADFAQIKQYEADAYVNQMKLQERLSELQKQQSLIAQNGTEYSGGYNTWIPDAQKKYNQLQKEIDNIQQQLNDPAMSELASKYKSDYVNDNFFGKARKFINGLDDMLLGVGATDQNKVLIQQRRDEKNAQQYDRAVGEYLLDLGVLGREDVVNKARAAKSVSPIYESAANSYKLKQKQVENEYREEYVEALKGQEKWNKYRPVAEAYKRGEQLHASDALWSPQYWFYTMPGMIGSSNSSPSQITGNIIQGVGIAAAVASAPVSGGASSVLMNAGTLAALPFGLQGAADENLGETGERRIDNLQQQLNNQFLFTNSDLIYRDLQKQSIAFYKKQGLSDEYIKNKVGSVDKPITEEQQRNILRDSTLGISKTNDPQFTRAQIMSTAGLEALYEADNMRTMPETVFQAMTQLMPGGKEFAKTKGTKLLNKMFGGPASKEMKNVVTTEATGKVMAKTAGAGAKEAANKTMKTAASTAEDVVEDAAGATKKYANGFRKPSQSAAEAFKKGYDRAETAADAMGLGYVGAVGIGAAGGVANATAYLGKQLLSKEARAFIDKVQWGLANKYQTVIDKLSIPDWARLTAKYGLSAAKNTISGSLSEAGEEGVQYLNSLEDYAGKYGWGGMSLGDLIINDFRQGGRVADAYLSLLGIGNSPLADDVEFWQNVKGGFAMGAGHSGIVNVIGNTKKAVKQYQTDQIIKNQALWNRRSDDIDRGAYATFAKQATLNREQETIHALQTMQERDSRRTDPEYTQEDYDDRINNGRSVMALAKNKTIRDILEAKGIKYGTDRYAYAIADIYAQRQAQMQNLKERTSGTGNINSLYMSKDFQDAVDQVIENQRSQSDLIDSALNKAKNEARQKAVEQKWEDLKKQGETNRKSRRVKHILQKAGDEAAKQAEEQGIQNARTSVVNATHVINKAKALLRLKAQQNTIEDWYNNVITKFGIKTKRPDAKIIVKEVQKQLDELKDEIAELIPGINTKVSDADLLRQLDNVGGIVDVNTEEIQQQEVANAMLNADAAVIQHRMNQFYAGIKQDKDGNILYNKDEDNYGRVVDAIIEAHKRNEEINWVVEDIFQGDALNRLDDTLEQEAADKRTKQAKEQQKEIDDIISKETTKAEAASKKPETSTPAKESSQQFDEESLPKKLHRNHTKYKEQRKKAKEAYKKNKSAWRKWKRSHAGATLLPILDDLIVNAANELLKLSKDAYYSFEMFAADMKDIIDEIGKYKEVSDADLLTSLKRIYMKYRSYLLASGQSVDNLDKSDNIVSYQRPTVESDKNSDVKDVESTLNDDFSNIQKDVSTYFDVVVKDGDTYKIYKNKAAIQQRKYQYGTNVKVKDVYDRLHAANTSDERFKEELKAIFEEEGISNLSPNTYVKYRNVDGIESLIARTILQKDQSIYLQNAIIARNTILQIFAGNEGAIDPKDFGYNTEGFIEDIKNLRDRIGKKFKILNTPDTIFADGLCSEVDILLINDDGDVFVIDVYNSYKNPLDKWNKKGPHGEESLAETQQKSLQQIQKILESKFKNVKVIGLATLPTQYIYGKAISIPKKDGSVILKSSTLLNADTIINREDNDRLNAQIQELSEKVNQAIDDLSSLQDRAKQNNVELPAELQKKYDKVTPHSENNNQAAQTKVEELENMVEELRSNISDLQDLLSQQAQPRVDEDAEFYDEVVSSEIMSMSEGEIDAMFDDNLNYLFDRCHELDMCLSEIPNLIPTTHVDRNQLRAITDALIDAQVALNFVLQDDRAVGVDLSKELELIASAVERIVENPNVFGGLAAQTKQLWASDAFKVLDTAKIAYYTNKISLWVNTIGRHLNEDIDDRLLVQSLYKSLLNYYFRNILDTAKLSADNTVEGEILKEMIEQGEQLISDFNLGWNIDPDPDLLGPDATETQRINAINVRWKDKYSISESHSPAIDQMQQNKMYYFVSNYPDFLQNSKFILKYDINHDIVLRIEYDGGRNYFEFGFISKIPPKADSETVKYLKARNRGNKKFLAKVKQILDYQAANGQNCEVNVEVSLNHGSIRYDGINSFHNVSEFLFKNSDKFPSDNNEKDLFTVTLSPKDDIGILAKNVTTSGKTLYTVYGNSATGRVPIGGFDINYDKQNLKAASGMVIYFYKQGGQRIGVPISGMLIGDDASKLTNLILRYVHGEDSADGYNILELLKQRLVVRDPSRQYSQFKNLSNSILIDRANGKVFVGEQPFDLAAQIDQLAARISQIPQIVRFDTANQRIGGTQNEIFQTAARNIGDKQSIQLPNGIILTKDDFLHQNLDGTQGSTWLGYLFRSGLLQTRAIARRHIEVNVDSVSIVDKTTPEVQHTPEVKKLSRDIQQDRRRQQLRKMITGAKLDMITKESELDKDRSLSEQELFIKNATEYFESVIGNTEGLEFTEVGQEFLERVSKDLVVAGECSANLVRLSRYTTMSTIYHESFHKVVELLLSDSEREKIYQIYRNAYGNVSDRAVAEGLTDWFVDYMTYRDEYKSSKGFGKIKKFFKLIGFGIGMAKQFGRFNMFRFIWLYGDINRGKFKSREATEQAKERFEKLFHVLHYEVTDPSTNASANFQYITDAGQMQDMVQALAYYILETYNVGDVKDSKKIKIDGQSLVRIDQETIDYLCARGVPKEELTNANLAYREVFGYEKYDITDKKTGKTIGVGRKYPKFEAIQGMVSDYIAGIFGDYKQQIEEVDQTDDDQRVQNQNIDKFDKASQEFSKLEGATEITKLFFATVPYQKWDETTLYPDEVETFKQYFEKHPDENQVTIAGLTVKRSSIYNAKKGKPVRGYTNGIDYSMNQFGAPVYMPLTQTFNLIANKCHKAKSVKELQQMLHKLANERPEFRYISTKFDMLMNQAWTYKDGKLVKTDYDSAATVLQIYKTIRSQKMDFVVMRSNKVSGRGIKTKIIQSSLERDQRMYSKIWTNFLISGISGVFKRVRTKNGDLIFADGKENTFSDAIAYFEKLRDVFSKQDEKFEIGEQTYFKSKFEDMKMLKSDIVKLLNTLGIFVTDESFDFMLSEKYGGVDADAIRMWLFENQANKSTISSFMECLRDFAPKGDINTEAVQQGYTKVGFVNELANWHGKYTRSTTEQGALSVDGKRLHSITQNSSISYITDQLSEGNPNNDLVQTLSGFNYNLAHDGAQVIGSIILKSIKAGDKPQLKLSTPIGYRSDNTNDQGSSYKDMTEIDDFMSKFTLLQQGYLIMPTLADKSTWQVLNGVKIPGMTFGYQGGTLVAENIPSIMYVGSTAIIRPSDAVLDQMIEYAITEKLAIEKCIEDVKTLSPEEKITNYHTQSKQKREDGSAIEPNGTRFLQFSEIVVRDGNSMKLINLNDPRKSSTDLLNDANRLFFSKDRETQREIMAMTLHRQNMLIVKYAEKMGLIGRRTISGKYQRYDASGVAVGNEKDVQISGSNTLNNIISEYLDRDQIEAVKTALKRSIKDSNHGTWDKIPVKYGTEREVKDQLAESWAIVAILSDVNNRSIISSQEALRCYIGHPAMFKVLYDVSGGVIKDSTFDIQKRIGGLISTGEDNVEGLPGMPTDYVCGEIADYEIGVSSDVQKSLDQTFEESAVRDMYGIITGDWDTPYDELLKKASKSERISTAIEKAKENAKKYSSAYKDKINVADGAAYITADMCERLLYMNGALDDDTKKALDILNSDATKYSWTQKADAFKTVYDTINLVTTKYTAYGFRKHQINGRDISSIAVPYYNKFALFPIFPCMATGKMHNLYKSMIDQGVDMAMMNSAVKLGSQGAQKYNPQGIQFNTYTQKYAMLRKQMNTAPEEGEQINLGTQTQKIVLQNLRPDRTYTLKGEQISGEDLLSKYMNHINELSRMGEDELRDEFFEEGTDQISPDKLSAFLKHELGSRNASPSIIKAIQVVEVDDPNDPKKKIKKLQAPLAATSDASWIESIVIQHVNKRVVDIATKGSSFVQRSVFAIEGHAKAEEGESVVQFDDNMDPTINGGERLKFLNDDGSMDAVISIDYFEDILPKGLSFDEAREWLIKNKIIGNSPDVHANTVGYRIPTQAESSIHALRFVDVVPATKSTIILPAEFTKITGSDFDIDHLYLASYSYNVNKDGSVSTEFPQDSKKHHQNAIIDVMLALLKDSDNSLSTLYRSIDNDTEPIESIADQIEAEESNQPTAFNFGALHEQVARKKDYMTGKFGIGPFALNATNHVLACLYNLRFKSSKFAEAVGINRLDNLIDGQYIYISSWLSGFINANVDIVKDAYIAKLNTNTFTYNMLNLLLRTGHGDASVWLLCQPIIRDLAKATEESNSQFMSMGKSMRQAKKSAEKRVLLKYMSEEDFSEKNLNKFTNSKNKNDIQNKIKVVNAILGNAELLRAIAKNPNAKTVTVNGVQYDVKNTQRAVYYTWMSLSKYADSLGRLIHATKIETKKHGKNMLEIFSYLSKYNKLVSAIREEQSMLVESQDDTLEEGESKTLFDVQSLSSLLFDSWINQKTIAATNWPFTILSGQTFNGNKIFVSEVMHMARQLSGNVDGVIAVDKLASMSRAVQTAIKSQYIVDYVNRILIPKYAKDKMQDASSYISSLLVGKFTIKDRLNGLIGAIKTNPKYERLKANGLITQLMPVESYREAFVNGETVQQPQFITVLDSVGDSKANQKILQEGWLQLLTDEDPSVRRFARDLIVYSFVTSGEYSGWNKLFKYVPEEWLFGELNEEIESYSNFVEDKLNQNSFITSEMVDDVVSNNCRDYAFCRRIHQKDEDGNLNYIYSDSNVVIMNGNSEDTYPYIYVSPQSVASFGDDSYYVYKRVANISNKYQIYIRIKKGGYHRPGYDIYEYGWDFKPNQVGMHSDSESTAEKLNILAQKMNAAESAILRLLNENKTENVLRPIRRVLNQNDPFDQTISTVQPSERPDVNRDPKDININSIADQTQAFGVQVVKDLKNTYQQLQNNYPQSIVADIINSNYYNSANEVQSGKIWNPFSENDNNPESVQKFYDWLVTGNNFGNEKATDEFRQAIIDKILSTPEGTPVFYYKELYRPSHATVIGYLINHKNLLTQKSTSTILQNNPEMGEATAQGTINSMNSNDNPEFTAADNTLKRILGGNPLKVVMASEHTDPAFHSKRVCDVINEELKKPSSQRKYHMLQIMTKHDGLPLLNMLELNIPKSVHFSISSLGGTQYEPGVMKMDDLLDRIEQFIKDGKLNPNTTTIRIDPIIPGVTTPKDVAHIMERASKMGIRSIKMSIMDSYGYDESAKKRGVMDNMIRLGYDFDKYYRKYKATQTTYDRFGNVKQKAGEWYWSQDANFDVMSKIYQKIDELAQKYNMFCTTCGEKPNMSYQFKRLAFASGCLNATGVASVLGVSTQEVENESKIGNQRPGKCNCLNCKSDILAYDDTCASQCAYCYAEHGSRAAMKYYDENGKLLDNDFTRTSQFYKRAEKTPFTYARTHSASEFIMQSGGAPGADNAWGTIAKEFGITNQNHWYHGIKDGNNAPLGNVMISNEDYEEGRRKVAEAAKVNWGYKYNTMKDDRLVRNWAQVKYADAIFAIGHIVGKGQKVFPNQVRDTRVASTTVVQGGTGYAVTMAINEGKPVYVFDQERGKWAANINGTWKWLDETPTLTTRFAGIGTRQINSAGIQAIRDVFEKTFSQQQQLTKEDMEEAKRIRKHCKGE